ncbi:MAG: hypothetical protein AB7V42_16930 [Thermoleophilia bacterium]
MADALDGLDAARRAGWARAFAAEEVAVHMLYNLFLHMYLNSDRPDLAAGVGQIVRGWLDGADMTPGWVKPTNPPPNLTSGQVEARIRIARRLIRLDAELTGSEGQPLLDPEDDLAGPGSSR